MLETSKPEYELLERTTRSVGNRGSMRLKAGHWRDVFHEADEVVYDLVELSDGRMEIRLRETSDSLTRPITQ